MSEAAEVLAKHRQRKEKYAEFLAWLLRYLHERDPIGLNGLSDEYAPEVPHIIVSCAHARTSLDVAGTIRDTLTQHFGRRRVGTLSDYYDIADVIYEKWREMWRPRPVPPPPCPACGSAHVLRLAYGMPSFETAERAARGEIALGGCLIDERVRKWECRQCRATFNDGGENVLAAIDYRPK